MKRRQLFIAALVAAVVLPLGVVAVAASGGPPGGGGGGGGGGVPGGGGGGVVVPAPAPVPAPPVAPAPAGADLRLTGKASNGSPAPGSTYTYTFQVKNSGPGDAVGVVLSEPIPAGIVPQSAVVTAGGGRCDEIGLLQGGSTAQCNLGTIAKGLSSTVVINVMAPQVAATVRNTASVSSASLDPVMTNNSVTVNVAVKAPTGGVCKGGTCDLVPVAVAAPCAVLTNVSAPIGYYSVWAAIWNTFTIQSCSTATETVYVQVQETNVATGKVDYDVTSAVGLLAGQNRGLVLDNDFAPFATTYAIRYTVRDAAGNVLSGSSVSCTTPPTP